METTCGCFLRGRAKEKNRNVQNMQRVGFGVWLKHNALFSNYFREKRVDIWNSLPPEVVKWKRLITPQMSVSSQIIILVQYLQLSHSDSAPMSFSLDAFECGRLIKKKPHHSSYKEWSGWNQDSPRCMTGDHVSLTQISHQPSQ